ncbi:MAG: glycosyltransferase family 9 protein [Ignavibacteriales bacterium]
MTTPLIRTIRKKNPSIEIDFIVKEEFADLLKYNPHLSNLYKYTNHKFEKQIIFNSLLSKNYNLVIDLQNNFRSSEITRPLHCEFVKFKKNNFKKFLLVQFKINQLKDAPQVPLRYAGTIGESELDDEGLEFITNNLPDSRFEKNKTYIGICPGAKHFTKRWPLENFISLGKKLESAGYTVVLFGGLQEIQICNEIENNLENALNLCSTNLLQVGADMKMCKVIYTNDSGLMHLAAALNVPVIAFFGSTVKEFGFFPYKVKNIVLENNKLSCRPCTHIGRKSCPKIHFDCMRKINAELAFQSLKNQMLT